MVLNNEGMRLASFLPLLGLPIGLGLASGACSPPSDLGAPCVMRDADGGILAPPGDPDDDQVFQGTTECENLVCLRPGGDAGLDGGIGFCSNSPCTPDNGAAPGPNAASQDCNTAATGLVCNTLTLDPAFVKQIDAQDGGAALLAQYLNSTYCTTAGDAG